MKQFMHKNLTYFYIAYPNPNPTGPSTPQYKNYPGVWGIGSC